MKQLVALALLVGCMPGGAADSPAAEPLRIFIRAGKKTHGPGEHDHPRFLAEWKELLNARGARCDGGMEFPTAEQLAKTDVLVIFAAEGGAIKPEDRVNLDAYLKRGGGIAVIHDAVCGTDPHWFKTVVGGAWEHGKAKFHHGNVGIYFTDRDHPITRGLSNFFMDDEIYWDLHIIPEARVLAKGYRTTHEITPQMWVLEKDNYRAFVNIQGHKHVSFSLPHYRALLLRGFAWAGKRDADLLVTREELASLRYPAGGPVAPGKAHGAINIPGDFEISLVIAEPEIAKPIYMDWDPRGRLWLALTPQYPEKAATTKTEPRDAIVVVENGKAKTWYSGLDLVTSFVFFKDGVIVSQAPEILWLRDKDGDGKAETREVLFSGFGFGDTHAVMSNFHWGFDGWIYATQGYSGGATKARGREGKDFGRIGNGLFRFKPDGSEIEMVVSYGSNTWGLDFGWDYELFFTMANGSHLRHVIVPDRILARGKIGKTEGWKDITDHKKSVQTLKHGFNPYLQIDNVNGFTAAAGGLIYGGGAWPKEYDYTHFVTECTINLIHQDLVTPEGVTYKAVKPKEEEFVASTDLWFRPIDVRTGPDGAMYVADFYNQAVVHNDTRGPKHGPHNAAIRPDRDHEHGRVWRLQHKSAKSFGAIALDKAPAADLVKVLEHPNNWRRETAHRLLLESGAGVAELLTLLHTTSIPWAKVHALWLLHMMGKLSEADLAAAFKDGEAGIRRNAARIAGLAAIPPAPALVAALEDSDPRVRLEALVALGSAPLSPEAARAIAKVYPKLEDNWSRSVALGTAASSPGVFMTADAGSMAADLAEIVGAKQDGEGAARIIMAVAGSPDNAFKQAVLARLAKGLKPETVPAVTPELQKALQSLLASGDPQVSGAALPFASRWLKDAAVAAVTESAAAALVEVVADRRKPDAERLQALTTALSVAAVRSRAVAAGAKLLDSSSSADLQRGAVEALGSSGDPAAGPLLVTAYGRLTAASRETAFGHILKSVEAVRHLLKEVEAERFKIGDLGPNDLFRLRNHPDKETAAAAAKTIDAIKGAETRSKDQIIQALLPVVEKKGDAAKGKELLAKNCLTCHQHRGEGRGLSPDLTGFGAKGVLELLTNVVDPNRAVEPNYVSFNVRTKDGDVFNGLVARETNDSVVLKNNEGDKEIRRSDIEIMFSSGLSLMPTGLESLGGEALRDIFTYLATDAGGFRMIDLSAAFTTGTVKGLYDPTREPDNLKLAKYGVLQVEGVPFNVVDPATAKDGNNAIVLKGGRTAGWASKVAMPRKVEFKVGTMCDKIHVLGGIGAWATLDPSAEKQPGCKVTYRYAGGATEEKVLHDGVEFSDWIRRVDVPGSKFAGGLLKAGARGQLRWFTLTPGRREVIESISLESYDTYMAPTFLAMTAQIGDSSKGVAPSPPAAADGIPVLIVGGGSSHDFEKFFNKADSATLAGSCSVRYTENPDDILPALEKLDVLYLSTNKALPGEALRKGIFDFADRGKGLLLVHPAAWYNWKDWPEYNQKLISGGARGHEALQEFEVTVVDETHPITAGVPKTFRVVDELYRFEKDKDGPEIKVLALGKSLKTGKEYPVAYTVAHDKGRIVVITLGHDARAHGHEGYQALLRNSVAWLARKK